MRISLGMRLTAGIAIMFAMGVAASGYILLKYRASEAAAAHALSGDQKTVLVGQLLEARLKAAEELLQGASGGMGAGDAFPERIRGILEDLKSLSRDHPDKLLEDARRALAELDGDRPEASEDLFVLYRNLKTSVFNLYRLAWANKWMNVARNAGLIINDLDNLPYQSGERAAAGVAPKINQTAVLVAGSSLGQGAKLTLLGQLNSVKGQVARYIETTQRHERAKQKRLDDLRIAESNLKKYNAVQSKGLISFVDAFRSGVVKALLAFLVFVALGMGGMSWLRGRFSRAIKAATDHITRQVGGWIAPGGNVVAQGFRFPERPEAEFLDAYVMLDQVMRRMNALRKEDILVKRLLNVPFLLVNRARDAIFWNSALSILGRVRALEEVGAVPYGNLLKLTDAQGKSLDPVGAAFSENREITQLALLRAGDDGIAIYAVCTPVLGPDHQAEYMMVHLRDLREENRRTEAELGRQLSHVRAAIDEMNKGKVPSEAPAGAWRSAAECVRMLRQAALDHQHATSVVTSHLETMRNRMEREAELKKLVHGRVERLRDELGSVRGHLNELKSQTGAVAERLARIEARGKQLAAEHEGVRKRGNTLLGDLGAIRSKLAACLDRLSGFEEIPDRIRGAETMIGGVIEKSTLLVANNSILGSKRELTPADVISVTENLGQLLGQFERGYRFISLAASEMVGGLREIAGEAQSVLGDCARIANEDEATLRSLYEGDRILDSDSREIAQLGKDLAALRAAASRSALAAQAIEDKLKRLAQIGAASIELQNQLESGFRGMLTQVS